MTDEEKAEEYFCEHCENSFEHDNGHCSNCSKWDYFIAGLAEGREEMKKEYKENAIPYVFELRDKVKELEKENEEISKELQDYQFNYSNIKKLSKENAELSNSVTELTNAKTELENKVIELEKQVKKMKKNTKIANIDI